MFISYYVCNGSKIGFTYGLYFFISKNESIINQNTKILQTPAHVLSRGAADNTPETHRCSA